MNREELLYRMKYLNWRPLLSVNHDEHRLIIRALIDEGGKLYQRNKPLRYDVVIDGITGPDADSLSELDRIVRRDFRGVVLEMWRYAWRRIVQEVIA